MPDITTKDPHERVSALAKWLAEAVDAIRVYLDARGQRVPPFALIPVPKRTDDASKRDARGWRPWVPAAMSDASMRVEILRDHGSRTSGAGTLRLALVGLADTLARQGRPTNPADKAKEIATAFGLRSEGGANVGALQHAILGPEAEVFVAETLLLLGEPPDVAVYRGRKRRKRKGSSSVAARCPVTDCPTFVRLSAEQARAYGKVLMCACLAHGPNPTLLILDTPTPVEHDVHHVAEPVPQIAEAVAA